MMEDGDGRPRTAAEIWGKDSIKLGYRVAASRLRGDGDAMDFLVGPEGVTPEVADMLDGLIAALTVIALDRFPETKAYRYDPHRFARKMLAELFDRWADVMDGIEPDASWWLFHGGRAAFERQPEANCIHCGKLMPLDDDVIRAHRWTMPGPPTDRPRRCPGSGIRPHDVLAPDQHLPFRSGT